MTRMILCTLLFLALCLGGTAQAQYRLGAGSGGQQQIGTGLPLPIGSAGIFAGGKLTATAGPAFYPPLLVGPDANYATGGGATGTIWQTGGTAQGGAIKVAPGVLNRPAAGTRPRIGVFTTNPAVFQVATTLNYAWPATYLSVAPGKAPGPAILGTGGGGIIAYSGGAKSFGGPGVFGGGAGPAAGSWRVPVKTVAGVTTATPIATVHINAFGKLPASAMTLAVMGAVAAGGTQGIVGSSVAAPAGTTMYGPLLPGFGAVNVGPGFTVGPNGTLGTGAGGLGSIAAGGTGLTNMVTASKGFPWTTGFITISQPAASPPEVFFMSGSDARVAGSGNVSMVAGSLSLRALSGPNANRGWLTLNLVNTPEPTAVLGAAGALGMLGLCHGLVRRRSS